ncbi:MAG TPA: F0F1 ATP synthase subunit B [Methylomirabilota bacterium]|jgi:F-type H+-transporting ATPase subunit b|nr:F0F1 ATP synthase subunit B [Methylomirabilota bacterium]
MSRVVALAVLLLGLLPSVALASEGEGGFINLDKSLIIQVVNFGLLLLLLGKFLYRPLLGKMEERSQAIKKSLEEAQAARAEAQREREEHAAKIQAAHAEAQAIRAAALKEAAEEQRRLVEAARGEAARLVEAAKAELDQDVRRAKQELRREVGDLAIGVAERLIRKSLRDDDHRRIVEDAVARLGQAGGH